jgi:hypothetical protein
MIWLVAAKFMLFSSLATEQAKKSPPPKLLVTSQVMLSPGKTTKVILRGTQFDFVNGIQMEPAQGVVKLLNKPKKSPPQNTISVDRLGDWEIEAEIELPKDTKESHVALQLTSPSGASSPLRFRIMDAAKRLEEKEPNNGYATAQVITLPGLVEGRIEKERDVDVYRVNGLPGEVIGITLESRTLGSAADLLVSVTDARGRMLETTFDVKTQTTSVVLPPGGACCITVQEASDLGGAFFGYLLHVRKR